MSFILKFLSGSLGPWIIIGSLLGSGFAGGLIVHKWHRANQLSELNAVLEKQIREDAKYQAKKEAAHEVRNTINALPSGGSYKLLHDKWCRDCR